MTTNFKKFNAISSGSWVRTSSEYLNKKTYTIIIKRLVLNALVGIHNYEKKRKQKISISLSLKALDNLSNCNDDIENVVSYEHIVNDIKSLISFGNPLISRYLFFVSFQMVISERIQPFSSQLSAYLISPIFILLKSRLVILESIARESAP